MARDRDDFDDFDDRPARRDRDSADAPLSGMDSFLNNTVVAVVLALVGICCCPLAALIIGGIGAATCKNPDSKRNAIIVLVGGVIGIVVNVGFYAMGGAQNLQNR